MQASDIPTKSPRVFAQSASGTYVRIVPQTTADPAAASFDLGFPPQTFTDEGAGGTPPDGRDVNGILAYLSAWSRWMQAGAPIPYDSTFQAAAGGYPLNSIVRSATTPGLFWLSTTDANVTNPDSGGAGWARWQPGGLSAGSNANGYWSKRPDGAGGVLIRQRGTVVLPITNAQTSDVTVTFPIVFTDAASIRINLNAFGAPSGTWNGVAVSRWGAYGLSDVAIRGDTCSGADTNGRFYQAVPVDWQAEGY